MKKIVLLAIVFLLVFSFVDAAIGPSSPPSSPSRSDSTQDRTSTSARTQEASKSDCKDLPTMKDRIRCRINLPEGSEYDYVPEECRAIGGGAAGDKCAKNYQILRKCFENKNYGFQVVCAKQSLNFKTGNVRDAIEACEAEANKLACYQNLKEDTYSLAKFRIYALDQHIENLKEQGKISEDTAVEAIAALEEKKQDFNQIQTVEGKKQVIREVQAIWRNLKKSGGLE
ncbi:MAG: hypothetical protein AABW87_00610 [Nanoarchaeota archaeon]